MLNGKLVGIRAYIGCCRHIGMKFQVDFGTKPLGQGVLTSLEIAMGTIVVRRVGYLILTCLTGSIRNVLVTGKVCVDVKAVGGVKENFFSFPCVIKICKVPVFMVNNLPDASSLYHHDHMISVIIKVPLSFCRVNQSFVLGILPAIS